MNKLFTRAFLSIAAVCVLSACGPSDPTPDIDDLSSFHRAYFMTQEDMADILGYSERQIRRLETTGTYNLYVISLIAETFNVEITDILFGMS
jgi:DNA-binding XRE family transcriptional regulator